MGAWGAGPFENDEALDYLGEIEGLDEPERVGTLARPLAEVVHSGNYLDGSEVTEAVAAAAFIGAVVNPSAAANEPYLPAWIAQVPPEQVDNELVELARRALRRVLQPHDNDLHELWSEAAAVEDWQLALRRVLGWLGDRDD